MGAWSTMRKNILFVCTGNLDRSPTAEALLKGRKGLDVQSAGTSPIAVRRVSRDLVDWADMIFVMEQAHKDHIVKKLNPRADSKIIVLNIPDVYRRNDPRLVEILKRRVSDYVDIDE
jgi:predicted protein tyrosine phosphatase